MYIAIYEMVAKPGKNAEFEKAWADVTEHIYARCGSLGSRLHTTDTAGTYMAYAQWPSREVYNADHGEMSAEETEARDRMKATMESARLAHGLEVLDDRLRTVAAK